MFKKIKNSKWLYVVLSVLMAVILWGYVIKAANPEQDKSINNIPVNFTGTEALASRNLIISEGAEQNINLNIKAKLDDLSKLNRQTVSLTVDVSKIVEAGEYRMIVTPGIPMNVSPGNVSYNNIDDLYVSFTVSKLGAKEIPVKGEFVGSVAEGYQLGDITVAPATIGISGQQDMVNQVAYAKVILSQTDMDATYTGELPFIYVGADGNELTDISVISNTDTVQVAYPVVRVKDVPLSVSILPGGGATLENVLLSFSIDGVNFQDEMTISLSGAENDIAGVQSLSLGEVDLSQIVTTQDFKFPVSPDPSLTNESGITEVTVRVAITGLVTREFSVSNINLINVPEEYANAEIVTQARTVMVRGAKEAVDAVFLSQLRIVADVSASNPTAEGRKDIPARVYLDGVSNVGVVGTYNITVNLSR